MGLFGSRPKWRDRDPSVRRSAVAELADADALIEVLRQEEDAEIARLTVDRLVEVGRADLLVEKLNARQLGTIAAIDATLARLERLQKEIEEEKRRRATRETTDPAALLQVIRETDELDVALTALSRIGDQRALVKVLRGSPFTRVIDAARDRITDPSVLREMVEDSNVYLPERRAALRRIADPAFHESVALDDSFPYELKGDALELLRDEAAVARIARTSTDGSLRRKALERVADDDVRAEIARTDRDQSIRYDAVNRIRDPRILEELALTAEDLRVRVTAARRQEDPGGLERLAHSEIADVRSAAIGKIRNPELLRRLRDTEKHRAVQGVIDDRLLDDDVLVEELRGDSPEKRALAVARLRDKKALETVVASDPALADAARARLAVIAEVEGKIREIEMRIENLKQLSEYRSDLELRVSGDSQVYESYMLTPDGRRSPLAQVDQLEAEISSLRRSLH